MGDCILFYLPFAWLLFGTVCVMFTEWQRWRELRALSCSDSRHDWKQCAKCTALGGPKWLTR